MEIKVLESSKKKIIFELKGVDHTFCTFLKDELWNDERVDTAGYSIDHPLIGVPRFVVEVKDGSPKDALVDAVKRLKKVNEKLKNGFIKAMS